jgi:hypothetical protein
MMPGAQACAALAPWSGRDAALGIGRVWSVRPDGTIIARAKTLSILDMAGMLEASKGRCVTIEEMGPWR